ncbi:unnamed protein product [Phaedon cochleariae]|uniref:Uncharacterized protein n=1 Tax=Phaedon cochleariae TaxID=80249 RepID=A0A9P0DPZ0_PHACE|nr:unnamed protein product [Phaedon cochleariae]
MNYLNSLTRKNNVLSSSTGLMNFPRFDHNDHSRLENMHKVNNLERRFLVWTGKFKSYGEVPDFVSQVIMEKSRNRMRIKVANYMILATIAGCVVMVYKGKQDAKRGESVAKQNKEWHAQIKADSEAKTKETS